METTILALALLVLGMTRELICQGTLFASMDTLLGPWASGWRIDLADGGILLARLPPGAFIIAGLLLAIWNGRYSRRNGVRRNSREQDQA